MDTEYLAQLLDRFLNAGDIMEAYKLLHHARLLADTDTYISLMADYPSNFLIGLGDMAYDIKYN